MAAPRHQPALGGRVRVPRLTPLSMRRSLGLGWQLSHRQPAPRPRPPMEALRHCGALGLCRFSSIGSAQRPHHTPKGIPPARVKHGCPCRKGSHVPTGGVFSWARVRGMMTTQGQDRTGQCLGEGEGEWIGCPPEIQAPVRTCGMLQLARCGF